MPDTVLSSLSYLILISYEEHVIISMLHMRTLGHREVKQPVENCAANL